MKQDIRWKMMYVEACEYFKKNGNLDITSNYITNNGLKLGSWISTQRYRYKLNGQYKLSDEQIELLNNIDMIWDKNEYNWNIGYKHAIEYLKNYGNLNVKFGYVCDDGYPLSKWLQTQRTMYQSDTGLSSIKVDLLNKIGMIWNKQDFQWMSMYKIAKQYYEENGNLKIPEVYVTDDNIPLGRWMQKQRHNKKSNALSLEQIKMLEDIGMLWKVNPFEWMDYYNEAKKYYEKNGNLDIPRVYSSRVGMDLYSWINRQRAAYYKLHKLIITDEQIELLNNINMRWEPKDNPWNKNYLFAKKYFLEHGDLKVPYDFELDGFKLGSWISSQRVKFNSGELTDEQIELLNEIGIVWNVLDNNWNMYYEEAKKYYIDNGNLDIKSDYVTKSGLKLGSWIIRERQSFFNVGNRKISEEQIRKLDEIGMIWSYNNKRNKQFYKDFYNVLLERKKSMELWDMFFEEALIYFNKYHHLLVDINYVTDNGIMLGKWIHKQVSDYDNKMLNGEQIRKLNEIGMIWKHTDQYDLDTIKDLIWLKQYNEAKNYYRVYGDLYVSSNYVTASGLILKDWIDEQYNSYNNNELSISNILMLNEIGFNLDIDISKRLHK